MLALPPVVSSLRVLLALVLLAGACLFANVAEAASGPWIESEHSRLRLISESEAVGEAESLAAGLQFELARGWKTYWRSPGDAGYPPSVDWSASVNVRKVQLQWPVPHRFSLFGLDTFGYEDEVVFPLTVVPEDPGQPLRLVGSVDYLLCEEICIPYTEEVTLALPAGAAAPAPEAFLIDLYRSRVPASGEESGISLERVGISGSGDTLRLQAQAESPLPFDEELDLLVEGNGSDVFGRPEVRLSEEKRRADISLPVTGAEADDVLGQKVRLTLVDGNRGLEQELVLARTDATGASALPERSLVLILGFALLGGLILNLMPCVLPVLSLKLLSVVKHGGGAARPVRLSFIATAAGILVSFLVLAAAAIAIKAAGGAVGWGIQFQQPLFLAGMALVVTLFAANLFGFFEIALPRRLADIGARAGSQGLGGAFATGIFATLLATPCSAPFLGTAVGFALSRGPGEILLIFALLGLGLSLPYLLVAAWPRLVTALPRPGRWMLWLRRLLGLALVATALWLLGVLAAQVGLSTATILGLLLAGLFGVFALRSLQALRKAPTSAAAFVLGGAVLSLAALSGPGLAPVEQDEGVWQRFEREAIADAVAEGRTVFVDVTAEWCITCQVNKVRVLDQEEVRARLSEESVQAMRADWTRPDEGIAGYLAEHGRYGIPFNAVYGPGAPDGILLPELLSEAAVLKALAEASAP